MAQVISEAEAQSLKKTERVRVKNARARFKKQGKTFIVPDEHWSGVMPEQYRSNLPGKKEVQ